jgi:hypothetical protein
MTREEKQKLNAKKLFNLFIFKKDIDAQEFDELRKALPSFEQEKMNEMMLRKKRKEIKATYRRGELSTSDNLLYENNLLLDRNRKNTSTIVTIIAINIVLIIIGALVVASNS